MRVLQLTLVFVAWFISASQKCCEYYLVNIFIWLLCSSLRFSGQRILIRFIGDRFVRTV